MRSATYFQVGDRVSTKFGVEGEVIAVELSEQPFRANGLTREWTKPQGPIEWVKIRTKESDDHSIKAGEEHEYAMWDLVKLDPQ